MRTAVAIVAIVVLGTVAVLSTVIVDASEHVVVTRFGRPTAVYSEPDLRLKWPTPIERKLRLDKRTLFLATEDAEFLTADKKNVVVATYLTWRIVDPIQFLSALRSREAAEARLTALVVSALGSAVGEAPFSAFVSTTGLAYVKGEAEAGGADIGTLEEAVLGAVGATARSDFGIEVDHLGVTRFIFPEQNLASVCARMRAERERIAKGHRAEGESEAQQIIAEANLKSAELTTAAEADAARALGEGEAEAARIYADAYEGYEDLYGFLRTLDAYERVLDQDTTILMSGDAPLFDVLLRYRPDAAATPKGEVGPGGGLALRQRAK